MTQLDMLVLRPTLPGHVHGIVGIDPPEIQCDGCGRIDTGERLAMTAIRSDIRFLDGSSRRRMCTPCWEAEGRTITERNLHRKDGR